MNPTTSQPKTRHIDFSRMEQTLSRLLRLGLLVSSLCILGGVTVSLIHHPEYMTDPHALPRLTDTGAAFPFTLRDMGEGLRQGSGRSIMTLGLLLLIATPVLRVCVSVVAFALDRDWVFALVTLLVLIVLLASFLVGRLE
ncbi:MAG: DUF1634 domain-containing protein [Phycisphaeraceae bacterium]|nr:DUF1634 domain-containing protein [Phycisphaeraceae bacterium]